MGKREAILETLSRLGPLCDDCLSNEAGVRPRQQVTQRCNELAKSNLISREKASCPKCHEYKYVNTIGVKVHTRTVAETVAKASDSSAWYWEGNVQSRIVEYLKNRGFTITHVANTGARESGKDIEAQAADGRTLWLSVKGYPEKSSNTQARHWFAETLFDLILWREQDSAVELGIGLPDDRKTYINLSKRVGWFKQIVPFRFYWVSESGVVREE